MPCAPRVRDCRPTPPLMLCRFEAIKRAFAGGALDAAAAQLANMRIGQQLVRSTGGPCTSSSAAASSSASAASAYSATTHGSYRQACACQFSKNRQLVHDDRCLTDVPCCATPACAAAHTNLCARKPPPVRTWHFSHGTGHKLQQDSPKCLQGASALGAAGHAGSPLPLRSPAA